MINWLYSYQIKLQHSTLTSQANIIVHANQPSAKAIKYMGFCTRLLQTVREP